LANVARSEVPSVAPTVNDRSTAMPTISVKRPQLPQGKDANPGKGVPPFSHHGILELAAPFVRQGYQVDLAASDRAARKLAFRPVEYAAVAGQHPALSCTLHLEQVHRAKFRLVRMLKTPDGLTAQVTAEGDDPARLLPAVEAIAPARQFHEIAGARLALSYSLAWWTPTAEVRPPSADKLRTPRLVRAETRVEGVQLLVQQEGNQQTLRVRIAATDKRRLALTTDFLAVLGWRWSPLRPTATGAWDGSLKVPRREPRRTDRLEQLLDIATAHLARTMASPPAEFNDQHRPARWRAAVQRLLPLLFVAGSVLTFVTLVVILPKTPVYQVLLLYFSIAVIVVVTLMDKAYRFEIPPLPRTLSQADWYSFESAP
jgi:hypothetical protein